ncbi:MAG: serine/threonine-protein kinase [Planctomycetaceae bacterium]
MAVVQTSDFMAGLQQSRLLRDSELQALRTRLSKSRKEISPDQLAQKLVEKRLLTPWQATQLLKGQKSFSLQQYQLRDTIGRGGMGHVFQARDTETGRVVAIKLMARSLVSNEALVTRFQREIKASARLNSPHVVKAINAGKVGETDFLVMEYVNGEQIDHIAARLERLPIGLACEIIRQTAVGLQHAHECGMVHRDVKPSNLMINWDSEGIGTIKLMDMGLVRLTEDEEDRSVTRAGQVMGTPDYMSPEQGWDTSKVDIRSDIYSLGCTCFRLLTGSVPFSGANPLQVLSQRLQRDAPSIAGVRGDVPPELAAVVSRMTMRDPAARFQSPAEVAAMLAPLCSPLTRMALAAATGPAATSPDRTETPVDSRSDTGDFDGTYHQFLRDMQDGADVDLAADTLPSRDQSAVTLPALKVDESSYVASSRRIRRTGPRRGQLAGFILMGVATLVLVAVAVFLWMRR